MYTKIFLLSLLIAASSPRADAFLSPTPTTTTAITTKLIRQFAAPKKNDWNDAHVAHNKAEVHEETDQELLDSENTAAWDAHDCNDAGMEAAAEERAVIMAHELMHQKLHPEETHNKSKEWNDQHLAHNVAEIHQETQDEVHDSEEAAAWDAHDAPDAGMEAAAEERAVMLAAELVKDMIAKRKAKQEKDSKPSP